MKAFNIAIVFKQVLVVIHDFLMDNFFLCK